MTTLAINPTESFLADRLIGLRNKAALRNAILIGLFALLTAAAAQIEIPLGFTPVPVTGQTFAVLLAGAALGPLRGAASQGLYVVLGAVGMPFYSGGESGIFQQDTETLRLIPTFGYLVGFVVAAYVVGLMARLKQDRTPLTAIPAFLMGSVVVYLFGATFLSYSLGIPFAGELSEPSALAYGIAPFVIGDVLKAAVAGLLLPAAWKAAETFAPE